MSAGLCCKLQAAQCLLLVRRSLSSIASASCGSRIPANPKISRNKADPDKGCPVCREGLQYFGYRDVLLLRQFLTPEGLILGRRHTKICPKLQRRVAKCIRKSRKMGLLPNFKPESEVRTLATPSKAKQT